MTTGEQIEPLTDPRKQAERDLHDALRGELRGDGHYQANKRFYDIGRSNHAFSRNWIGRAAVGKSVLDYCCGDGETALFAASQGARKATGIDISPVSVEAATAKAVARGLSANTAFEVMDAENMSFADASFDLIVVGGVLHHLDLDKAYRELARVLKPGGQVFCLEALKHNPIIHWYRKATPHLRSEWETAHILGRAEILAAKKYFGRVRVERFFHLTTLAAVPLRNTSLFSPVLGVLEVVDRGLLKIPGIGWQAWQAFFTLADPKHE
jgi:ubiquinone/menaquinone biosynthesis C-methylase UbiE